MWLQKRGWPHIFSIHQTRTVLLQNVKIQHFSPTIIWILILHLLWNTKNTKAWRYIDCSPQALQTWESPACLRPSLSQELAPIHLIYLIHMTHLIYLIHMMHLIYLIHLFHQRQGKAPGCDPSLWQELWARAWTGTCSNSEKFQEQSVWRKQPGWIMFLSPWWWTKIVITVALMRWVGAAILE